MSEIQTIFHEFYAKLNDGQEHIHSGLDSALYLHQALYETCLSEALAYVPETVSDLLRVGALRALDPKLVERTYSTLSLILRTMACSLLKPNEANRTTLKKTWITINPYLSPQSNKRYVRRCVADAWVGVIRKARSEGLARLMELLMEDNVEGMAAVWAHSLKGASGQLHSRALAIYTILLDNLVKNPIPPHTTTLGLVSTSLVHHTSASVVQPVIELVISKLESDTIALPASTAVLDVLSTFLFTRKGKRFPEATLKPLMQKLLSVMPKLATDAAVNEDMDKGEAELKEQWRKAFVVCIVGSLQAGQLAQWLSPGVTLIDNLWQKLVSLFFMVILKRHDC